MSRVVYLFVRKVCSFPTFKRGVWQK